jgi:GTP cyclohydrolase II
MRQEGRGIGLYRKLDAYKLQDAGLDTFEANLQLAHSEDARDYRPAVQMLNALQIRTVRLITNNPDMVRALVENDIAVAEVISTQTYANKYNLKYLSAKRDKRKHALLLD